jgi:hypothetical protein
MIEVDWATLFKSFYVVVRIKVACRDPSKIPRDRLYEMNKSIFVVSFEVEGGQAGEPNQAKNVVMLVMTMRRRTMMQMMMRMIYWMMTLVKINLLDLR